MPARRRFHPAFVASSAITAAAACAPHAIAQAEREHVRAQPHAAEAKPKAAVLPPRLEHDPGVAYPKAALERGFHETVSVNLVLEIDATGRVSRASLERPAHAEFDALALAAANELRFTPATRGGTPAAARIRFRYVFAPPAPVFSGKIVDQTSGAPLAGVRVVVTAASGAVVELTTDENGEFRSESLPPGRATAHVRDERYEPQAANVELTHGSDTRMHVELAPRAQAPSPAGAPSERALEVVVRGEKLAPAVTTLTREEVRQMPGAFGDPFRAIEALPGVTPIGSGIPFFYVRGAPPGNVGYFLDGIRVPFLYHVAIGPSVIHPGLVERVDLHPGGYPSRYGRFAGGLVAAETAAPRADWHGEANVRLFDAGALAEGGFADGRGTLLLGGRYSYTAALLSVLVPDLRIDYRDYQARATYELTNDDRIGVFAFGSYDLLGEEQRHGTNVLFGSEFYRVDLRHEHDLSHGALETHLTLGFDQSLSGDDGNTRQRSASLRSELRQRLGRDVLLRAGAELSLDAYATSSPKYFDPDSPEVRIFLENSPDRSDRAFGVWNDYVISAASGVEFTPGVRVDLYESQGESAVGVEPRLAARFFVRDNVTLVHTLGIAHQPPSFVVPIPGRTPAALGGGLQRAIQASSGAEIEVAHGTKLTGTLFYNIFSDMTDALATNTEGPPGAGGDQRVNGYAYGAELMLHRSLSKRLGGFVSYTLSRSMRSTGSEHFPSSFDRTHVANAALAYDLGRKWRAGGRVVFYTGTPDVPEPNGTIAAPRGESPPRTDAFFRVDLRLEKRWDLTEHVWLAFVTEVMNATLSKETFGDQEVGPVTIPSLGLELGF